MAEPAQELVPEEFDPEDIPPEEEAVTDSTDSGNQPDQPYTKERHQQNVDDIKQFLGKKEKPAQEDAAKSPEAEAEKPDVSNTGASDAAAKVSSGKNKFGQAMKKAGEGKQALGAAKDIKENALEYAKEIAKERAKDAAKKYAKQLARQISAQLKKAIAQAATKLLANPYVLGALAIILLIIVIVVVIFVLFSVDGQGGKGPAQFPQTALQKQQSNFLLAISGDKIAQDTAVKEVIDSELARYDRIITNANTQNPGLSASIVAKKAELDTKLIAILAEQSVERRKTLRDQLQTEMNTFEATLPFGSWIVALAEARVGQPNLQFCSITGATAKVACASFTSTVMYLAGVPNPIEAGVDGIWNRPFYQTVVDRPATKSAAYYRQNAAKLQPGDLIFWGDGACSPNGSVLFDHVGFYVGNGQAIDTSSSEEKVLKRSASDRGSCRVFNGAKRYGQ